MRVQKSNKIVFLLLLMLNGFAYSSSGQEISMEQTLSYINSKLGADIKVDVFHGIINSKYTEGGKPYREDEVNITDLDTNSIKYNATEKMFTVDCKGSLKDCVQRQLNVLKLTRSYGRISYYVQLNEKGATGMQKAFRHLIRLVLIRKYKSSEPFE